MGIANTKCKHCQLVNLSSDRLCRRCGKELRGAEGSHRPIGPRDRARRSSPLLPLLALTLVGAAVYYVFSGAEKSVESVQPTTPGQPIPVTRQPQANAYKNAVQNSNALAQGQKHTAEIEKLTGK